MKASRTVVVMLILGAVATGRADPLSWPHTTEYRSRLAWVHPLVNYSIHPAWQRAWERHLLQGGGVQITVGSVSTDDLFTRLIVNLDQPLSGPFRFQYRGNWRDGLHLDEELQEHWLGFELAVARPVGAFLHVHPTPDKEDMDLRAGLVVTDGTRERYLRLAVRWDDFLYGKKNDLGGTSDGERVALQWEARWAGGRWEAFTRGDYGTRSRRTFPDPAESPLLAAHERDRDEGSATLRFVLAGDDFVAAGVDHYRFAAAEAWHAPAAAYDYRNEVMHLRAVALLRTAATFGLRPEFHWLRQWADSAGWYAFDHRREDVFPALFVELRAPGRSTWELGYLASHHTWDHVDAGVPDHVADYTDKLKLGWTFAFTPVAALQLSLSHELDLERFGGGNVQYQMLF
jgi:hypothetical protein